MAQGKYRTEAMADITSQAANAAVGVEDLDECSVHVFGTFSATWTLQVSADGTNFVDHPSHTAETGSKFCLVPEAVKSVRVNCTAFTSGTIEAIVGGKDDDRLG